MAELSVEDLTCQECGKVAKSKAGLVAHSRRHEKTEASPPPSVVQPEGGGNAPLTKIYTSPHSKSLRIVFDKSGWERINTPTGVQQLVHEGYTIEFDRGKFKTSDPKIIEFLDNYRGGRFPVICLADMK